MIERTRGEAVARVLKPNTGSNIEVAIPPTFNRESERVLGFMMACKLFIRIKMREEAVEKQVQ